MTDDAVDIQACAGCGGSINRLAADGWVSLPDGRCVHVEAECLTELARRGQEIPYITERGE